jgi:outer membrane lipoprotein-sorting protein
MLKRPRIDPAFVLLFSSAVFLSTSCAQSPRNSADTNINKKVVSSTPPFETREPERYRATRITTTVPAGGQPVITKTLIARDGELRRDESQSDNVRVVYLTLPTGQYLLLPDEKLFATVSRQDMNVDKNGEEDSETSPDRLLHTEWVTTSYEKLGTETIGGRNLEKYRIVVNNSAGANVSTGETFLWFDETLHMPVRTQSTSPDGTRVTTELSDIVLKVDKQLFEVPKDYQQTDYKKVSERLKP